MDDPARTITSPGPVRPRASAAPSTQSYRSAEKPSVCSGPVSPFE